MGESPENEPVTAEPEPPTGIGNLGIWAVGIAGGFFLTAWLGIAVIGAATSSQPTPEVEAAPPPVETAAPAAGELTAVATEFAFELDGVPSAGTITFTLSNQGAVFHDLAIEDGSGALIPGFLLEADPGETVSGDVELAPGTYTLFCTIPGHREAGMETLLTVGG